MSSKHIKLTVFSDLSCPWCYIGQKDVLSAIKQVTKTYPHVSFELEYRPYRLHPSIREDEPLDREEWFVNTFGEEKANKLKSIMLVRARQSGVELTYSGKICSTFNAQRLLHKAWTLGGQQRQQALLGGLFKAYLGEGAVISDKNVLADISEKTGVMRREQALKYLKSDEDSKKVDEMIEQACSYGVTGVPLMIIDGKWAISGGQGQDVYLQVFQKLAVCNGSAMSHSHTACPTQITAV